MEHAPEPGSIAAVDRLRRHRLRRARQLRRRRHRIPRGGLAAVDLDLDGKPELVVTTGLVRVFLGNGLGGLAPVKLGWGTAVATGTALVADVNNDGKRDLVAADDYGIAVLLDTSQ